MGCSDGPVLLLHASLWSSFSPCPTQVRGKTSLMTRYCTRHKAADEVPDPYYGGAAGFERVLDLLEDASQGLLEHIQSKQQAAKGTR